ncbi:MAG: nicotinate (nicotinamide) nucleotide adenylyltransferase [Planctomycetes bacterium]|nr:nicotinate (nicotinamide) nucleotide adenylyltransferase [Planctomycetota bacterium]
MKQRTRVLFGGSFDPPTIAHRSLIQLVRQSLPDAEIVVIVAGQPPHKDPAQCTPAVMRLELARLAFGDLDGVRISDEECRRAGPSYTVETLARHRGELGGAALYWLIGADSLLDLPNWREPHRILELAHVLTVARPGFDVGTLDSLTAFTADERAALRAGILEGSGPDVSSSAVRRDIREGCPIDDLVDAAVLAAIRVRGLYIEPCA